MTISSLLHIIFVAVGAVFLVASVSLNFRKNKDVPLDLAGRWHPMSCLMVFCLAGCLGFLYLQISPHLFPLELLTCLVFLGGAFEKLENELAERKKTEAPSRPPMPDLRRSSMPDMKITGFSSPSANPAAAPPLP